MSGSTLIETMAALAILSLTSTYSYNLLTSTLQELRFSTSKFNSTLLFEREIKSGICNSVKTTSSGTIYQCGDITNEKYIISER